VDATWNAGAIISRVFFNGTEFNSSSLPGWPWSTAGMTLYIAPTTGQDKKITLEVINLPPVLILAIGYSLFMDMTGGCTSGLLGLTSSTPLSGNVSISTAYASSLLGVSPIASFFNLTFINLGDAVSNNCDLVLYDVTLVAYLCSSTCLSCLNTTDNCTSCGYDSSTFQQLYLDNVNFKCVSSCLINYYLDITSGQGQCDLCDIACASCFIPFDPNSCNSCNQMFGFFNGSIPNSCINSCGVNEILIGPPYTCLPCDIGCASCTGFPTNCQTCVASYFLYGTLCSTTCPNNYYGDLSMKCQACLPACFTCSGAALTACSSCNNVTNTTSGTITIYYKDANATTCATSCTVGSFPDTANNLCVVCHTSCLKCKGGTAWSCTACSGTFLTPSNSCDTGCPASYFPNSTLFKCLACLPACLTCTAADNTSCTSCNNVTNTTSGTTTIYYKDANATTCLATCPAGQYSWAGNNSCLPCAASCLACVGLASNCTGGLCQTGFYSYNNSCLSACPNNTYTFSGQCLTQCPAGYVGSVSTTSSTCVVCDAASCSSTGFTVATKVANGGSSYEHKVDLPEGLSSQSSLSAIQHGLTVDLATGTARLLLSTVSLSVQSVSISTNRAFLTILTNYYPANALTSSVSVNFQAGTLLTGTGIPYNQLSGTVVLNNPTFLSSYYTIFSENSYLQA
jgi:hypothetical protein